MIDVFKQFFILGWISFGGPAAHIGYFQKRFVQELNWISQEEYGKLVALSQFLPGPGSSQVCFAIGNVRAGLIGALAAFIAFTLPSFLIMVAIATTASYFADNQWYIAIVNGLKLMAVVIVLDAIYTMSKSFCNNVKAAVLALLSCLSLVLLSSVVAQVLVIVCAGIIGILLFRNEGEPSARVNNQPAKSTIAWSWLTAFCVLFIALPLIGQHSTLIDIFNKFYQAGSLVFGGGHVVLPLLQEGVGEQLTQGEFLTGYAAAQAVPGPMFTFATYLGFLLLPQTPILGAIIATLAIFIPGFLLVLSFQASWSQLMSKPKLANAVKGINAAVVGILAAALINPIAINAISSVIDVILVIAGITILRYFKLSIFILLLFFILTSLIQTI